MRLNVRRIINDPNAAALPHGCHDRDAEKHLLAIDLREEHDAAKRRLGDEP